MPSTRRLLAVPFVASCVLACVASDDSGRGPLPVGPDGKADSSQGSCRGTGGATYCGKKSNGACWCDDQCASYGDCCSDRAEVCEEAPPEGTHLDYASYRVAFTNPVCRTYEYDEPIQTVDGQGTIEAKPRNVYCTQNDSGASGSRPTSPIYNLLEWTRALQEGDSIFLAYLSFSSSAMGTALCDAAQRGVDVTFVLDAPTDKSNQLASCGGNVLIRGHKGGIGYQHNKIIMINADAAGPGDADPDYMRVVFSSGNMSSGTVLHHENWHFIEVARKSFFAEAHRCMLNALVDEAAASSTTAYRNSVNTCRAAITFQEEDDIHAYFIPNRDDSQAVTDLMVEGIGDASTISIGAHRFAYTTMIDALSDRLQGGSDVRIRLVADDDLYWLRPYGGGTGVKVGDNEQFEASAVAGLVRDGEGERFEVRYMETNHGQHLLHHSKYLLFEGRPGYPDAVLCGAANLTGTGFWTNFENIYWVEIPEVVEAFRAQYGHVWDSTPMPDGEAPPVATPPNRMPARDVQFQ
ncbi:MAG: hypothetical protein HYY06_29980 [Deltaproteobacteria bacterium]|nr:hypothetical protein [Deltaproteobacteria bacterium]